MGKKTDFHTRDRFLKSSALSWGIRLLQEIPMLDAKLSRVFCPAFNPGDSDCHIPMYSIIPNLCSEKKFQIAIKTLTGHKSMAANILKDARIKE